MRAEPQKSPKPAKKKAPAGVAAPREQVSSGKPSTAVRVVPVTVGVKASLSEVVTREFHEQPVVQMTFRGRRCWLLSSIEKAMEYAEGALGGLMRDEWSSEFRVGHHFDIVQGVDLQALRANLAAGSNLVANAIGPKTRTITVLYTEGVDLAALKTEKPVGRAVRAFLVDNVMQPLRETGRVDLTTQGGSSLGAVDIAGSIESRQNHINEHLEKQVGTLRFRRETDRVKVAETVRHYALRSAGVAGRPAGRWTEQEHYHALDAIDGLVRCLAALADVEIVRREFDREDAANAIRVSVNQLTLNLGRLSIGGER